MVQYADIWLMGRHKDILTTIVLILAAIALLIFILSAVDL